ncbi:MAG: sugar phosphate isomerase/epimerase, partial [Draconibacterium sp.]|nr:sugar phosphate isomerase/epimerase [Draconibacterium sp.]
MTTRRNFIKTTAFATGALSISPFINLAAVGKSKLKSFGFISGIAKKEMEADWIGTLKKAVEFGFTELEAGSGYANSPKEFLKVCKDIGIKPFASGSNLAGILKEPNKFFDEYNELNYKYLVCYWPWMGGAPFKLDDCKKSVELLNELGEKTKKNGLKLCWHNHDKEFHEMEEGLPFDYLMENTDPDLVDCEMDIYWVKKGGGDPLEVLKKYAGRIPILHVKDMAPGVEQDFICPGSGIIDFKPIFAEAKKQKIKHYIVERDREPDGIGCLR